MRTKSKAMQLLEFQCGQLHLNSQELLDQTKTLLRIYHAVVWNLSARAEDLKEAALCTYGMKLDTALLYLSDLAPDMDGSNFTTQVTQLFQGRWLIRLLDLALQRVASYPDYGDLYASLIQYRFMEQTAHNDARTAEYLLLEHSTYYDRKKEAIFLYGLSLWGYVIPSAQEINRKTSGMGVDEETFFSMLAKKL